jgi:hypothetical protein
LTLVKFRHFFNDVIKVSTRHSIFKLTLAENWAKGLEVVRLLLLFREESHQLRGGAVGVRLLVKRLCSWVFAEH